MSHSIWPIIIFAALASWAAMPGASAATVQTATGGSVQDNGASASHQTDPAPQPGGVKASDTPITFAWRPNATHAYTFTSECTEKVNGKTVTETRSSCDVNVIARAPQTHTPASPDTPQPGDKKRDVPHTATWPVNFILTRVNLTRTDNDRVFTIIKKNDDWLWLNGDTVLIDTSCGIGVDTVYYIERRINGQVTAGATGKKFDTSNHAPNTLGLLGQLIPFTLPPGGLIAGKPYTIDVKTRILGNWTLAEPRTIPFTITPSIDTSDPASPKLVFDMAFRQMLVNPSGRDGFKLTSLVDTQAVIGAGIGRGTGRVVIDMSTAEIVSATLSATYSVTVPGKTRNERMTIVYNQTLAPISTVATTPQK